METLIEQQIEVVEDTKALRLELDPEYAQEIKELNAPWLAQYQEHIDPTGVYATSPEVCEKTAEIAKEYLKEILEHFNLEMTDTWAEIETSQSYMEGLLNRVNIPDTFKDTIERNILHIVDFLKAKAERSDKTVRVRSFFTGAAIAEKALFMRAHQAGIKDINLITTDINPHSIAFAAANLKIWNETLPEQEKYDIVIINGEIPDQYYNKPRTVILQIGDAKKASERDTMQNCQWDALLIDNGFPYVPIDFVSQIVGRATEERADDGMIIAMLGLNERIKVAIPILEKLKKIINKDIIQDTRERLAKEGKNTPNNYEHKYTFSVDDQGNITISDVVSHGAALTYNWIKRNIKNPKIALEILNSIKKATGLSSATKEIITNPTEHYAETVKQLSLQNTEYDVLESTITWNKYGWKEIPTNLLTEKQKEKSYLWLKNNKGEEKTALDVAEIVRQQDPVVLQTTVIKVKGK